MVHKPVMCVESVYVGNVIIVNIIRLFSVIMCSLLLVLYYHIVLGAWLCSATKVKQTRNFRLCALITKP